MGGGSSSCLYASSYCKRKYPDKLLTVLSSNYILTLKMYREASLTAQNSSLLALPAEIRNTIIERVFDDDILKDGFLEHGKPGGIVLDISYKASDRLRPFSACKQLYNEGISTAWDKTNFISSNRFGNVRGRLYALSPRQIASIRNLTFVADAAHFRDLIKWNQDPFGLPNLRLDTLTILLHPGPWHYLFDYTSGITYLLRRLQSVRRITFIRNRALVKGGFRTWYNRLIGLMMKVDHFQRYDHIPSNPERVWWRWSYDELAQTISMEAQPPRPLMGEEPYFQMMLPLMQELKTSIENEEPVSGPSRHDGWGGWSSNPLTSL